MSVIVRRAARIAAGLPADWERRLQRCYGAMKAARDWRLPITRLHGATRRNGRQATLLVVGEDYGTEYLSRSLFRAEQRREPLGDASVWKLEDRIDALSAGAALTVVQIDRLMARFFFRRSWLVVPGWVGMVLRLPPDLEPLTRSCGSVKEDMRMLRQQPFQTRLSSGDSDVERFYHGFYVPTTLRRHGDPVFVRDEFWLRKRARRGGILWIHEHGRALGGMLFERRDSALDLHGVGILDGDPALMRRHVFAAMYWAAIQHASKLGCGAVDFGGVRPSLNDGLLRYKRKWGATLADKSRTRYDLLVGWNEWNEIVAGFLADTPLIIRCNGRLHGIGAVAEPRAGTEADAARSRHLLWTDGLAHLALVSTAGWEEGIAATDRSTLISGSVSTAELIAHCRARS